MTLCIMTLFLDVYDFTIKLNLERYEFLDVTAPQLRWRTVFLFCNCWTLVQLLHMRITNFRALKRQWHRRLPSHHRLRFLWRPVRRARRVPPRAVFRTFPSARFFPSAPPCGRRDDLPLMFWPPPRLPDEMPWRRS